MGGFANQFKAQITKFLAGLHRSYLLFFCSIDISHSKSFSPAMIEIHSNQLFYVYTFRYTSWSTERYDMCTVDNLKHVLLNFRKHIILLCCFAMSPAVLLLHDDKDDVATCACSPFFLLPRR